MVVSRCERAAVSVHYVPAQTLQSRLTAVVPDEASGHSSGADDPSPTTPDSDAPVVHRRWMVHTITILVVAIGAILTVVLAFATWEARANNEERLLRQRTREAAAVLTAALPGIETPLASGAEVVEESAGADQQAFERLLAPLAEAGQPYVSASLWRVDDPDLQPVTVIGTAPKLVSQPPDVIQRVPRTDGGNRGARRDRPAGWRRSPARLRGHIDTGVERVRRLRRGWATARSHFGRPRRVGVQRTPQRGVSGRRRGSRSAADRQHTRSAPPRYSRQFPCRLRRHVAAARHDARRRARRSGAGDAAMARHRLRARDDAWLGDIDRMGVATARRRRTPL